MARAIARTRIASDRMADVLRLGIVSACALALIAAGQSLPF
jgi:hypothetical protein